MGEPAAARRHLTQGITLYDPQQHRDHVVLYGLDSGVACSANLGLVLWALGSADQALQHLHRALALARDVAHPNTLQYALTLTAIGHHFRREARDVQEQADAIYRALTMSADERAWRATGLKEIIRSRNPGDWVDDQLADIERKRAGAPAAR